MKDDIFFVIFTNHCLEKVFTCGKEQAIILAQEEQIKKGHTYNVAFVKMRMEL